MIAWLLSLDGLVALTVLFAAVTFLRDYIALGTGHSPGLAFVHAHWTSIAFLLFLLFATRKKGNVWSLANSCRVIVRLLALVCFGWLVFAPFSPPLMLARHWRAEVILLVFLAHQIITHMEHPKTPGIDESPPTVHRFAAQWASALVFAAGVGILSDSLRDYFLCDDFGILRHVSHASFPGLLRKFVSADPGMTVLRPATLLSWKLDYLIWGDSPFGFHLTNTVFHAANAVLVFLIAKRVLPSLGAGIIAGLLFAIHPAHADAVIFIAARYGVLCTFFYLLSLLSFIAFLSNRRKILYSASLLFFALALANKETALTLPLAVATYDLVRTRPTLGRLRRVATRSMPFFAMIAFYFAWRVAVLGSLSLPQTPHGGITILGSGLIGLEIRLVRSPLLYLFSPRGTWHPRWTHYLYLGLFAATSLVFYLRREFLLRRGGLFAFFFIFIAALTGASLMIYPDLSGIRVLYLPSAGLAMLFGLLISRGIAQSARPRWPSIALLAILLAGFVAGSLVNHSSYHEASRIAYDVGHAPSRFYPSFPVSSPTLYVVDVPRLHKGAKLFEWGLPEAIERLSPGARVIFVHDDAWLPGMRSSEFNELLQSGKLQLGRSDFVFLWDPSRQSLIDATEDFAAPGNPQA